MSKQALIIFVKNPELGKVKTRLAATVGDEKALDIYKRLLEQTMKSTINLPFDKYVFYSQKVTKEDIWDDNIYYKQVQISGDLGQKMSNAFKYCFEQGYENVCIIGSDLIDMSEGILLNAFDILNTKDAVIGPAKDGGYYLLGMNKLHASLFENMRWSTESVLLNTKNKLNDHNLTYSMLPELNDIDTESDWKEYLAS